MCSGTTVNSLNLLSKSSISTSACVMHERCGGAGAGRDLSGSDGLLSLGNTSHSLDIKLGVASQGSLGLLEGLYRHCVRLQHTGGHQAKRSKGN